MKLEYHIRMTIHHGGAIRSIFWINCENKWMWPAVQDDQRPIFNASSILLLLSLRSDPLPILGPLASIQFNELIILLSCNPNSHLFIHYHKQRPEHLSIRGVGDMT